jgi:hypothetical protein
MADQLPTRAPWLDPIKRSGELRIALDPSLGTAGWDGIFRNAILEFNRLSGTLRLGVTFVREDNAARANVIAKAERRDFDFEYPPDIPRKTLKFDGKGVHGLCKPLLTMDRDKYKVMKAFIYVPATPMGEDGGRSRVVGDGVKLVIAVHEMVHACGLVDDREHSVDDLFCWPQLRMGSTAAADRLGTLGGKITFPGKPGEPPRTGHSIVDLPPLFLKQETATKVRSLWT